MKSICVLMDDKSVWEIPAMVIAENRADFYERHSTFVKFRDEVIAETLRDDALLLDWASKMEWEEVAGDAIEVRKMGPDFEHSWKVGEKGIVEHDEQEDE